MRLKVAACRGAMLSALLLAATTATAMAGTHTTTTTAPTSTNVGLNLGQWLGGLGSDILIPLTGLFGIAALFRRDFGHALVIAGIAILVGIFVYEPAGAKSIITAVANTLTK